MNIKKIEEKIDEISKAKSISEDEIVSNILAHLIITYENDAVTGNETAIIDNVKRITLDTLYSLPNQKQHLHPYTDYGEIFGFDRLDLKYANKAWNELEADGLIYIFDHEVGLTDKGILKIKNL